MKHAAGCCQEHFCFVSAAVAGCQEPKIHFFCSATTTEKKMCLSFVSHHRHASILHRMERGWKEKHHRIS